jgi:hypothetical protein
MSEIDAQQEWVFDRAVARAANTVRMVLQGHEVAAEQMFDDMGQELDEAKDSLPATSVVSALIFIAEEMARCAPEDCIARLTQIFHEAIDELQAKGH